MLRQELIDFVETDDPAEMAILCNIAFKAMFSAYKELLDILGRDDAAGAHRVNQSLIARTIEQVGAIEAARPDALGAAGGFDALRTYLRTAMLEAELNMLRAGSRPR